MAKKSKTLPEDLIPEYIADEKMRKAALDFVAWLRLNKLTPGQYDINRWRQAIKA